MKSLIRSAAKAGLQSASIMAVADITTQLLVEKRSIVAHPQLEGRVNTEHQNKITNETKQPPSAPQPIKNYNYDPLRTLRWATVGLTLHGPYFFLSFGKLDQRIIGTTVTNSIYTVAKKTAIAQILIFPPYLVGLFTYMGIMEGGNTAEVFAKVQDCVPKAFMSGCIFWPIANFINFSFVSTGARVPYLAAVGGLWNGYLSYMNAEKDWIGCHERIMTQNCNTWHVVSCAQSCHFLYTANRYCNCSCYLKEE